MICIKLLLEGNGNSLDAENRPKGKKPIKHSPGEMLDSLSRCCCLLLVKDVLCFQLPSLLNKGGIACA